MRPAETGAEAERARTRENRRMQLIPALPSWGRRRQNRLQVAERREGWQLFGAGHMGLKKGWIILDSITYISCHMYQHGRKFLHIAY